MPGQFARTGPRAVHAPPLLPWGTNDAIEACRPGKFSQSNNLVVRWHRLPDGLEIAFIHTRQHRHRHNDRARDAVHGRPLRRRFGRRRIISARGMHIQDRCAVAVAERTAPATVLGCRET